VADDDTAQLLSALENFRNVALGRLRNGSEAASRILDQEMSTRLLHLACRHDAVECARLLLDGGHGITASLVDARDPLMRTPLHIAAETHSARCIQLLLSSNARTDLRVVDGRPLIPLEVALMSKRCANGINCYYFLVKGFDRNHSQVDLTESVYAMLSPQGSS
jgi:ankyrin repeat protein